MNKNTSKQIAIALLTFILFSNINTMTYSIENNTIKEENIYGNLNHDGSVKGLYVVNSYNLPSNGTIIDYGNYSSVKNLSSDTKIDIYNYKITTKAKKGKFYYQGNLNSKQLPWNIEISYKLNGKEITPENLPGTEGELEIFISLKENKSINNTFFENFLMQVTLILDTTKFQNINAKGATIGNVGNDKQIMYTILPGTEKEISITADVRDFSMAPISFKGVQSIFEIDKSLIDLSSINEETSKINNAINDLNNGASDLSNGMYTLSEGSSIIKAGLSELNSNSSILQDGSSEILKALNLLDSELQKINLNKELIDKFINISNKIEEKFNDIISKLPQLETSLDYNNLENNIWDTLSTNSNGEITKYKKNYLEESLNSNEVLIDVYEMPESNLKSELINYIKSSQSYIQINNEYNEALQNYLDTIKNTELSTINFEEMVDEINSIFSTINNLESFIINIDEMKKNINILVKEYSKLNDGINSYTTGVDKIVSGYSDLENGIFTLQNAVNALKKGTSLFKEETANIDGVIDEKVDQIIYSLSGLDYKPKSFVSDKNNSIESVQFALVTDEISMEKPKSKQIAKKPKSFFKKLLDIFNLKI